MSGPDLPAGLRLRRAREADAEAITQLVADAYGHYVERIGRLPKPMATDQLAEVRDHEVWVLADPSDSLVGVLDLIEEPGRLFIENMAVAPSYQGQGLGRWLLEFAESGALRHGYGEIALETNERFVENLAIYARRGYVETGRTRLGTTDVVHLSKSLRPRLGSHSPPKRCGA